MNPYSLFLALHIFFGSIGLFSGSLNLFLKKGGKRHLRVGRIFVFSMIATSIFALILSILKFNFFLLIIGIFTIYLVGTGQRYLFLKKLNQDEKPKLIDWILTGGMGVVGIVFMGWGIFLLFNEKSMGWALLLFGLIGLLSVRKDIENYSGKSKKRQYWLRAHIARIVGAYIASMTAFLVVNQSFFPNFIPEVIYWILPTFVLTPLIVYWIRKFAKK
jgi:uncharacterized membrane protein